MGGFVRIVPDEAAMLKKWEVILRPGHLVGSALMLWIFSQFDCPFIPELSFRGFS